LRHAAVWNAVQATRVIACTSSILRLVPLVFTVVYSATKPSLHSYVLSWRFLLKGADVWVLEMASLGYVQN
jgi:short-subunit dehydrogenase involved in D-alanine esterification of teichoic acids